MFVFFFSFILKNSLDDIFSDGDQNFRTMSRPRWSSNASAGPPKTSFYKLQLSTPHISDTPDFYIPG